MTGPGPDPDPAEVSPDHHCQWCSAPAPAGATNCPTCGASLAERESLGDTLIPGVTGVDPSVKASEEFARGQLNRANARSSLLGPAMGGLAGGLVGHVVVSALESYAVKKMVGDPEPTSSGLVQLAAKLERDEAEAKGHERGAEPATGAEAAAPPAPDPWADLPAAEPAPDPWADLPAAEPEVPLVANELVTPPGAPGPNELTFVTPGTAAADPWAGASDPWAGASDPWSVGPQPSGDPWATSNGPWSFDPAGGPQASIPPAANDPWATSETQASTDSISSAAPAPERENRRP